MNKEDCNFREFYLTDELKKAIVNDIAKQINPLIDDKNLKSVRSILDQNRETRAKLQSTIPFFYKFDQLLDDERNGLNQKQIERLREIENELLSKMVLHMLKSPLQNLIRVTKDDILNELELFATSKDMENCLDAYDVIDALVEFYTEEYELTK